MKIKAKIQDIPSSINGLELSLKHIDNKSSEKSIEITIKNKSSIDYSFGKHFSIEKKIKNTWYYVPFESTVFEEDIALVIQSNSQHTELLPLNVFKTTLTPGEYRVLIFFNPEEAESKVSSIQLAAPFRIEE
ncbi:immunoglobulin-like domain-containing protein [Bacillus sp. JJ722]|uniref:immunoglobulin-like domain-containing protein n=1 Tax=Bacillus sp. JJ722 TaxID=3122973 RepID=UPI00300052EB